MFPNEMRQTYYIPGCDSVPAKGKLYQAYKSYREKLGASGLISLRSKAPKRKLDVEVEDLSTEDSLTIIEFLKTHTDPWSQIFNNWTTTWAEREILLKETSADNYFETFPCLRMANGFELVRNL